MLGDESLKGEVRDGDGPRVSEFRLFFLYLEFKTPTTPERMNIQEVIDGLLARDNDVTYDFFYGHEPWSCSRNIHKILHAVFRREVDYYEAISALYAYLMADDGRRLRTYDPEKSSFFYWFKTVVTRFCLDWRDGMIDFRTGGRIEREEGDGSEHVIEAARPRRAQADAEAEASDEAERRREAKADMQRLLFRMPNKRYAYVLQQLVVLEEDPADVAAKMGIRVSNLYNIRKRAMEQLEKTATSDIERYGK